MFQKMLDAIERLRNATIEAEKRKHAQFIAGFAKAAIEGGLWGGVNPPESDWDDVDAMSVSALGTWATAMESAAEAAVEEN